MKHTVDNESEASTPGQIEISKSKYLDFKGFTGITRLKYSILFSLHQNLLFRIFKNDDIVFEFVQKTEQFRYGCANPTIVLDKEEGLIATYTNLTSYGDEITPVVKISKEPFHLIRNTEIQNEQKIATVALYFRDPQKPYAPAWADFDPKIANCFTDDLNACNNLVERISEERWQKLKIGLSQIRDHRKIGLYHIKLTV